jgi:hypothetical protein
MVGGRIIGIKKKDKKRQTLLVLDRYYAHDTCRIDVGIEHPIKLWDNVWWQSEYAYWTPLNGKETKIKRIGYSY